jgi:hypothetical protein
MEPKHKEKKTDWKSLVHGFVGDVLERLSDNISQKVHVFITKLKRRTAGAILLIVGSIFLLVSIALLINSFFSSEFQWIGWGLVGLIIVLIGRKMIK